MLPRRVLWALPLLLVTTTWSAAPAAAGTLFYETTIVSDTASDYAANGALDIVAIHASEKFAFSLDAKKGINVVDFRFELRARDEMSTLTNQILQYDLHYKIGDQAKHVNVTAMWNSQSGKPVVSPACGGDPPPAVCGFAAADSVMVRLDAAQNQIVPGLELKDSYGTSGLVTAAGNTVHDVAPTDNHNAPAVPPPTTFGATYTTTGGFEFLRVATVSPLTQFSVRGKEVEYELEFQVAPGLTGDTVLIYFQAPAGWDITPSRGNTGENLHGEFNGVDGGQPTRFSFTAKHNGSPPVGSNHVIRLEWVTLSGGHVVVDTVTTISEEKITDAHYAFELKTPGPFKEDKAVTLSARAARDGLAVSDDVSADLKLNGKLVRTIVGAAKGGGLFEFPYTFDQPGDWTVDVYVSGLSPAPHKAFTVHVEKKGVLSPSPEAALLLVLLLGLAWRRRR